MATVGYLGIPGSYSYIAAEKYFKGGNTTKYNGLPSFLDVFQNLHDDNLDYGVVPIENTLAGSVYENYDLLEHYDMHIIGELYTKIEHCLLVSAKNNISAANLHKIKKVYSHQKALEQCSNFFIDHPWIERVPYSDTANAAKYVGCQKAMSVAAIASKRTSKLYNLCLVEKHIEDDLHNYTRFIVVSKKHLKSKVINKCSLIILLPHVTGSLYKTFSVFAKNDCNVMKIESRPWHGRPFEYVFYFDFEYDETKHKISVITKELQAVGAEVKLIGLYEARHVI